MKKEKKKRTNLFSSNKNPRYTENHHRPSSTRHFKSSPPPPDQKDDLYDPSNVTWYKSRRSSSNQGKMIDGETQWNALLNRVSPSNPILPPAPSHEDESSCSLSSQRPCFISRTRETLVERAEKSVNPL